MSTSPLGRPAPHESGLLHASGEALYADDVPEPRGTLYGLPVGSPHAHARLLGIDAAAARAIPGVAAVLLAGDVPGENQIGAVAHDEPLLADGEVLSEGQPVALVVADSLRAARAAAKALSVRWEPLPALLTIEDAVAAGSFHRPPHVIERGQVREALAGAAHRLSGVVTCGGQDHFYLETQASLAIPEERGTLRLVSSTQHPSEVQAKVAEVLGWARSRIVVEVPRMGGGFGGKETQAAPWAALAALAATRTGRPVKVWLNRDQDMVMTGKRHPFRMEYDAGLDGDGRLVALDAKLVADGGWALDLSHAIVDRALFHATNCYFVPHVRLEGRIARTHKASNTAFRGFGGPQGMLLVEAILSRAAEKLGLDPAELRRRSYYGGAPRDRTPFEQEVKGFRLDRIHEELLRSASWAERRAAVDRFNATHEHLRRGLSFSPVMFGISFTNSMLNQAGALVLVYADGSVQLNHGGTEMGQGLHTKMRAVAAHELGVPLEAVRVMVTSTEKVPNTSATAASSGADLNGQAVREACATIRERLRPVAAELLGVDGGALAFEGGAVRHPGGAEVPFAKVAEAAWAGQVSLSATGYYRTPGIHYDHAAGRGKPFHYYAFGAAVIEVEVSSLTGEHRVLRADILHDVGDSLVPTIDRGQVEGAFVQGLGWLTSEELVWSKDGRLLTHAPSTYKIPAVGDAPEDLRVALLEDARQETTIHGSKAVGEPPLMLAIGVVGALRQAIGTYAPRGRAHELELRIPCTPEAILRAVEDAKALAAATPAGSAPVAAAP